MTAPTTDDLAVEIELRSEYSATWLRISRLTGLPTELGSDGFENGIRLSSQVEFELGGVDRRGSFGDLVYDGKYTRSDIVVTGDVRNRVTRTGREYALPVNLGGWKGEIYYHFGSRNPSILWGWRWAPNFAADDIRDFLITIEVELDQHDDWQLNAPGSRFRSQLPWSEIPVEAAVGSIGATAGSSGTIALSNNSYESTVLIWPRSLDEIGETTIGRTETGLRVAHATRLAAAADSSTALVVEGIALDILPESWDSVRERIPAWLSDLGVTSPHDKPEWTETATIFEVQIGTSLFAGGTWTYSPYPEVTDLLGDLPRIRELGFDTIQLMPRQPFPSYNVIDYDDIDTTYGNEAELIEVVRWCHDNGMHFILDVLMHGVIDKESITSVADSVRSGPWAQLAVASIHEVEAHALTIPEQEQLSWSRHILDFEAAWRDNSPAHHPLTDEHPEWFCTDSRGNIIGVYTKAFDISNPGWQRYFCDKMVLLVSRLNIDGFRFDAPSYNRFPNWSPRTRTRASLQQLGGVELFRQLRQVLHELDPELLLYTEPNGALWRQSMDLNYNYDETWLPDSIMGTGGDDPDSRVRDGADLAKWLSDRDYSLPRGSLTAHHIDSHDTFWWPLPTLKWRREQFGIAAATALMTAFSLSGGPYMTFVGGETGMESAIRAVNSIRSSHAGLLRSTHQFGAPIADDPAIFTVTHRRGSDYCVLAVNLSANDLSSTLSIVDDTVLIDLLAPDERVCADGQAPIHWGPYQARFMVRA